MDDGNGGVPGAGHDPAGHGPEVRGIQQVASELGITMRAVRFYEDKGLIRPERIGTTRVYNRREFARLQLVLRGKRLGFSVRDIAEFLDLYDADPQHTEQMRRLSERLRVRIAELQKQHSALEQTIAELRQIDDVANARIAGVKRPAG